MMKLSAFTEKELIELGIKSISVISEPQFKPIFYVRFLDEEKESIKFDTLKDLEDFIIERHAEIRKNKIDGLL